MSTEDTENTTNPEPQAEVDSAADKLQMELAEMKDKYLRALADFENYKKRSIKERSDLLKYEGSAIVTDLLQVVDNLELALSYSEGEADKLRDGLRMVHKLFIDTLAKWQVKGTSSIGKNFDPNLHAAISKVAASDGEKPGTIKTELRQAYHYKDKLLRPAEVVVISD